MRNLLLCCGCSALDDLCALLDACIVRWCHFDEIQWTVSNPPQSKSQANANCFYCATTCLEPELFRLPWDFARRKNAAAFCFLRMVRSFPDHLRLQTVKRPLSYACTRFGNIEKLGLPMSVRPSEFVLFSTLGRSSLSASLPILVEGRMKAFAGKCVHTSLAI